MTFPPYAEDLNPVDIDRAVQRGDVTALSTWLAQANRAQADMQAALEKADELVTQCNALEDDATDAIYFLGQIASAKTLESAQELAAGAEYVLRVPDTVRVALGWLGQNLKALMEFQRTKHRTPVRSK